MSDDETAYARWKRDAQERELAIVEAHAGEQSRIKRLTPTAHYRPAETRNRCLCAECTAERARERELI